MDVEGYLPLVLCLIGAAAAAPLSGRLPPRTATWLLTAMGVVLAVSGVATLAVLALGGALRLPLIAALGHLSERVLHHDPQTDPAVATAAGLLLTGGMAAASCTVVRQVRALLAAARTCRALPGDQDLAIIDDEAVEACALPGRPGRVVVSTGMLAILSAGERRALLAHERAHLHGRHHLFRAVTAVAAAINPLLWPLRSAVAYATERWADEVAAATIADREQTARAIGKAALARTHRPGLGHGPGRAASLGIGALHRRAGRSRWRGGRPGPVPRRVAALLAPPPSPRPGLVAAAIVLAVLSLLTADDGAINLHQVIEHAQVAAAAAPSRH
jgi:Zn-dependent protease with chaperone function